MPENERETARRSVQQAKYGALAALLRGVRLRDHQPPHVIRERQLQEALRQAIRESKDR